jgi:hypothetical protein
MARIVTLEPMLITPAPAPAAPAEVGGGLLPCSPSKQLLQMSQSQGEQ